MTTRFMVETQVKPRGVNDPLVLAAVEAVDRERFVPDHYKRFAYSDCPLPLSMGQTISQPFMVAAMTEYLNLNETSRVLEIGTGSGYQTAVLAEIVREVYTIEIIRELATTARNLLDELGYDNIHYRVGDGWRGWPEAGPFDGIMLTAAPEKAPLHLVEQMKTGRFMIAPCGPANKNQVLYRFEKEEDGHCSSSRMMDVRFVPLTGDR